MKDDLYRNGLGLHPLQVLALAWDDYDYDEAGDLSATSLLKKAKQLQLQRRHHGEIVTDVSMNAWAFFGKMLHGPGLTAPYRMVPGALCEERMQIEVEPTAMLDPELARRWETYCRVHGRPLPIKVSVKADAIVPRLKKACPPPPEVFTFQQYLDWYCENVAPDKMGFTILDHKVTATYAVIRTTREGPKADWFQQLNTGALLFSMNTEYEVTNGLILAICKDWKEDRADEQDYPACPFGSIPIPILEHQTALDRVSADVRRHVDGILAEDPNADLPECGAEFRWQDPPIYCVYHPTAGRVVKGGKHDTMKAAMEQWNEVAKDLGKDYLPPVRMVTGEPRRCMRYCEASPFCDEGKKAIADYLEHGQWMEEYHAECARRREEKKQPKVEGKHSGPTKSERIKAYDRENPAPDHDSAEADFLDRIDKDIDAQDRAGEEAQ